MKKLRKDDIVLPKFVEDADAYVKLLDVIAKHNFVEWSITQIYNQSHD